eukprot:2950460-Amphidinium_carterae.1
MLEVKSAPMKPAAGWLRKMGLHHLKSLDAIPPRSFWCRGRTELMRLFLQRSTALDGDHQWDVVLGCPLRTSLRAKIRREAPFAQHF